MCISSRRCFFITSVSVDSVYAVVRKLYIQNKLKETHWNPHLSLFDIYSF